MELDNDDYTAVFVGGIFLLLLVVLVFGVGFSEGSRKEVVLGNAYCEDVFNSSFSNFSNAGDISYNCTDCVIEFINCEDGFSRRLDSYSSWPVFS